MISLIEQLLFQGVNMNGYTSDSEMYKPNKPSGTLVVFPGNAWSRAESHKEYRQFVMKNQNCFCLMYKKGQTIEQIVDGFVDEIVGKYNSHQISLPIEGIGYSLGGVIGSQVLLNVYDRIREINLREDKPDGLIISEYTAMNTGKSIYDLINMYAHLPDEILQLFGITNINLGTNIRELISKDNNVKVNIISSNTDDVIDESIRPYSTGVVSTVKKYRQQRDQSYNNGFGNASGIGSKILEFTEWLFRPIVELVILLVKELLYQPIIATLVTIVHVTYSAYNRVYELKKSNKLACLVSIFGFLAGVVLGSLVGLFKLVKNAYGFVKREIFAVSDKPIVEDGETNENIKLIQ